MSQHIDATTPYPWPFDGDLSANRLALVVCGWTERWWNCTSDPAGVVGRISQLAAVVSATIVLDHRPLGRPADRVLASLTETDHPGAEAVLCAGIDGFYGSPLDGVLRSSGRDHLLLVGLGLETTVHSTMRSANDRGYECLLVADACAPLDPSGVGRAVSMVEMSGGIFGAVGSTNSVLAALRGTH